MLGYIQRRKSVTFEELMVVMRREGNQDPEEDLYQALSELVDSGRVVVHATNYGVRYLTPQDAQLIDQKGDEKFERLLPLLKSHMSEEFTVNSVHRTLGHELKLQSWSEVKGLLIRLEKAGSIRELRTESSRGGPSVVYEVVSGKSFLETIGKEAFSVQSMAKGMGISRRQATKQVEEWLEEGKIKEEGEKFRVITIKRKLRTIS